MRRICLLSWSETTCECEAFHVLLVQCIFALQQCVLHLLCRKIVSTFSMSRVDDIICFVLEGEKVCMYILANVYVCCACVYALFVHVCACVCMHCVDICVCVFCMPVYVCSLNPYMQVCMMCVLYCTQRNCTISDVGLPLL